MSRGGGCTTCDAFAECLQDPLGILRSLLGTYPALPAVMCDTNTAARREQERRIAEQKAKALELSGGEMVYGESPDMPLDLKEQFWRRVVSAETATTKTLLDELVRAGVELPGPASMDDEQLTRKLWEVIYALADMRNHLESTDHLGDRELYTVLYERILPEEFEECDDLPGAGSWHIDILGGCSPEDIYLRMKYYADESRRADWMNEFPDYEMPPHEDPPYDRDSKLP